MNAHEALHQYFRDSCRNDTGSIKEAYELSLAAEKHYAQQEAEVVNLKEKIASQANMIDKLQVANESLKLDVVELKKTEDQLLALEDKNKVLAGVVVIGNNALSLLTDDTIDISERVRGIAISAGGDIDDALELGGYTIKALEQTKES